jgi:AcrR family transcriptional regulator
VLKREGYSGLTTNKVAEAAGVSVGSLYQYFPGKDALVIALLLSFAEQQQMFVFNAIFALRDAPIEQVVRATVDGMRKAVQRDPELSAILMHHIPRVGELGEVVEYFQRQVAEPIAAFLANRQADLGVRDTRAAAFLLAHSVQPLLERLRVSRLDADERERVFEELCAMITAYLRAPQP